MFTACDLIKFELIKSLENELIPLESAPKEDKFYDVNMGWSRIFDRLLSVEKRYDFSNENQAALEKIQMLFDRFVKSMKKFDFSINEQKLLMKTYPLHLASFKGCKLVAISLIKKGANVDARDENETTPLYHAAIGQHAEVVKVLLEKGANPNKRCKLTILDNLLPLHIAIHPEVIKLLVNGSPVKKNLMYADKTPVNATSEGTFKFTALQWNVYNANLEGVKTLLDLGAIDIKDRHGASALDVARKVKNGTFGVFSIDYSAEQLNNRLDTIINLLEDHHQKHHLD